MPSLIDRRIAARIEQKQVETLLMVEGIADRLELIAARAGRAAMGAIVADDAPGAVDELRRCLPRVKAEMEKQFRRLVHWSHRETVRILAREIPRRWMRRANPIVVYAGEAETPPDDEEDDELPDEWPDWLNAHTPTEPLAGKGRMPDKQWEEFLRENVFPPPSPEKVEQIVFRSVHGQLWTERLDNLSRQISDFQGIASTLVSSYADGQTREQIAEKVQPFVRGIASSARRIARTEGMQIATLAQREQYNQLGDMLAGVQIQATLDENTRPHHAARHGRIYWNDRRRTPSIDQLPVLPDEPNCRCLDVPVLKEPEEFKADPALRAQFANAGGEAIPDPEVYNDWFERASRGRRMMAVGAKRYQSMERQLTGQRPPQWTDFIDEEGKLLSVQTLRAETVQARAARLRRVQDAMRQRKELLRQVNLFGFVKREPKPAPRRKTASGPAVRFPNPNTPRVWKGEKSIRHRRTMEKAVESLPEEGQALLKDYTRFSRGKQANWRTVNAKLWQGKLLTHEESTAQENLRGIHRRHPPLPRVTTIHRGLAINSAEELDATLDGILERSARGEPFSFRSNGSGSLNPETALKYAAQPGRIPVLFEIKAKTGIYLQQITTQPGDFEVLQADFVRYNLVRIQRAVPYGPQGHLVTVVQLQEL